MPLDTKLSIALYNETTMAYTDLFAYMKDEAGFSLGQQGQWIAVLSKSSFVCRLLLGKFIFELHLWALSGEFRTEMSSDGMKDTAAPFLRSKRGWF